ncbi:DUF3239 domain-containing protein [Smaragdicoccus niigatensis]
MHATNGVMRRFEFAVDRAHLRTANEIVVHARRFRISALVSSVIFALGAAVLLVVEHPWSYILGGVLILISVTALWVGLRAPRRAKRVNELYRAGVLVPAIVAEVRPRGAILLALVDISKPNSTQAQMALVTRRVQTLPGHAIAVGERVPAVPDLSDRHHGDDHTWQVASVLPLAWGTPDPEVIAAATSAITDSEWESLEARVSAWRQLHPAGTRHIIS